MLGFERLFLLSDFCQQGRIVLARLFIHAQFFELHVQFENFFEQIRGNDLFLDLSGGASLLGGAFGLLFEVHAFQMQQVFGALDRVSEGAVSVVEQGTLFQAPFLFLGAGARVQVGMKLAAQFVESFFQGSDIEIQLGRQPEKREIVDRSRRLHFTAGGAEVRGAHGPAGPAGVSFLRQGLGADRGKSGLGHCCSLKTQRTQLALRNAEKSSRSGRPRGRVAGAHTGIITQASGGERRAAAARFGCLGIHEYEALLHQRLLIIQGHAVQIDERLGVDENPHIGEQEDAVAFARLCVEADVIAQTRTAAALDAEAQAALLGRNAFLGHGSADFGQGFLGNENSFGGSLRGFQVGCGGHAFPQRLKPHFIFCDTYGIAKAMP